MALSDTTNSTLTARQIITTALEMIGMIAGGATPSPNDAATSLRQLNFMLKSMEADGCNMWRDRDALIAWPANTQEGTLDPNFLDVFDVLWIQNPGGQVPYQRLLQRFERGEYDTLPNKTVAGSPTIYSLVRGRTALEMRLWPVPTTETFLKCNVQTIMADVTTLDQNVDVPQMWLEAVYVNLADRLQPFFGTNNPQITARAQGLYSAMRDYDRPSSINMGPW